MTERPQMLKIGAHPFGDEARAFNLIGLPSLQLRFQTCNGKVEEGIGQAGLLVTAGTNGLLHDRLRLMNRHRPQGHYDTYLRRPCLDQAQEFLRGGCSRARLARLPPPALIGASAIPPGPNIAITYCRLCNWLLRAGWMGQELLSTFAEELGSVTLIPDDTGGVFEVRIDGKLIWSRKEKGRFPEIKELKQLVRDEVAPERDLGHLDKKEDKP